MRIEKLDAPWLAGVLGLVPDRVHGMRYAPLGTGQVADTYRVSYRVDDAAEQHVVLKLTSADPASVTAGRHEQNFLREVRYYQVLAPQLSVRVPRCWHAEIDETGTDFVLVLEDLSACRPGDQLRGCTVDEAVAVLSEAAKLHAPRWGDPALRDLAWLPGTIVPSDAALAAGPATFQKFCHRYTGQFDAEITEVGRYLFDHLAEFYALKQNSIDTVQHGDFRPDNLLFGAAGDAPAVAVVDWQTVCRGSGVLDVSYFLGGSLPPEQRAEVERDLLRHYHGELRRLGVADYTFEDCWRDYTRFAFQGYWMGVLAAMAVKRTDRGDRMFAAMVQRAGRHASDLGAVGCLG
ncbi:phosphotransferase [Nocardia miyunensis]|uniref:phosphotransferase n=1 Tax=Nocardia miyunensis TaxID=282684 RepID=UPI00082B9AEF|nr:phosphotransferase [Nocardia miyunensis]